MPDRRMISKKLVTDDSFLDMGFAARALYFTLVACADDDGFVNGPRSIVRQIGATQADLDELITYHYLFLFESGVVAIRHWKLMNSIPKDRYHPTMFREEAKKISVDRNGVYQMREESEESRGSDALYTECIQDDTKMYTECKQDGNIPYTEVNISKDKLSKVNRVNIYTDNNLSVNDCFPIHSVNINKELSTLSTRKVIPVVWERRES